MQNSFHEDCHFSRRPSLLKSTFSVKSQPISCQQLKSKQQNVESHLEEIERLDGMDEDWILNEFKGIRKEQDEIATGESR